MSVCAPTQSKGEQSVALYEQLRQRVLAGNVIGNRFGLIWLLREGLAAWVSHCATLPASFDPLSQPASRAAAPRLPDPIHSSVVNVLVGMVLRGPGEMNS